MSKCDNCKWYRGREYALCFKDRFVGDGYSLCTQFEKKKPVVTESFKPPTYLKDLGKAYGTAIGAVGMNMEHVGKRYEELTNKMMRNIESGRNPFINTFTVDDGVTTKEDLKKLSKYCKPHDSDALDALLYGKWNTERKEYNKMFKFEPVKKVIFNPPATIVYWFDGTKTIVKAQDGEIFDKEKGFAMACAKKFFGNEGNYYNEFRKHGADKDGYSISVDTALIGKVVRSGIEDGVFSCTCELDPSIVDQLCELGNVTDHTAGLKTELTCDGPITEQHIEASVLDEKPVGADPIEFIEKIHKKWVQEPTEKAKEERVKKHIIEKVNVLCDELETFGLNRDLEVSICNRGVSKCYDFVFGYEHSDGKSNKYMHSISYDDMKEKSVIWLAATIEDSVSKWLDELYREESE